jgi:hypothetical protein
MAGAAGPATPPPLRTVPKLRYRRRMPPTFLIVLWIWFGLPSLIAGVVLTLTVVYWRRLRVAHRQGELTGIGPVLHVLYGGDNP